MKKRILSGILAVMMTMSLLTGCGGNTAPTDEASAGAETAVESTVETEEESAVETAVTKAASEQKTATGSETDPDTVALDLTAELVDLTKQGNRPVGGLVVDANQQETDELSEEETEELDRAMRDYKPGKECPLVNNAKKFYYYDKLNEQQQEAYDAVYMMAEDPTDTGNGVVIELDTEADDEYFNEIFFPAYYALMYDHPELFWLYASENDFLRIGYRTYEYDSNTVSDVYLRYTEPYTTFEEDVKAFNKAAKKILKDIDPSWSDKKKADKIHDKLIGMCKYDHDVAARHASDDLAHSAYGALVANSSGDKNTCVCDGYALAYVYLCQQAGLQATVICGMAGSDKESAGGHAWSMVKVKKKWKEVDVCWDDYNETINEWEKEYEGKSDRTSQLMMQAITDKTFVKSLKHHLNRVSTSYITNFKDIEPYVYRFNDGAYITFMSESVHIRMNDTGKDNYDAVLMELAPVAK